MKLSYLFLPLFQIKSGCRRKSLCTNCAEYAEILSNTCHSGILFIFYVVLCSLDTEISEKKLWEPSLWELSLKPSNLRIYSAIIRSGFLACLLRWWGCNLIKLDSWDYYNWPLHSICKSVIFSINILSYTIIKSYLRCPSCNLNG